MSKKLITGNEALALGALHAGVRVVTGYPGTPSTGALASLLDSAPAGVHVEWSTNEKVALEIATGASWAGQRALCTMKMSGLNVAFDTLASVAYSGCVGGLVIYVADDPGVSAGMVEQDTRGFALMSDLPMLEPNSVGDIYRLTRLAFEISERIGTPVFVRLVTSSASSYGLVEIEEEPAEAPERPAVLIKDITRFTKAGAAISMAQHRAVIARLDQARDLMHEMGLNTLQLSPAANGVGIIAVGITASYLAEGFDLAGRLPASADGTVFSPEHVSILQAVTSIPFPAAEVEQLLRHCSAVVVLEELEPYVEREVHVLARRLGLDNQVIGKLDGAFSRIGEYGPSQVVSGIAKALGLAIPTDLLIGYAGGEQHAAARPITVCAGCPHRGSFMAINQAIRKLHLRADEVMVTGDIGCTILGMNPPFNTCWTEISMGSSIPLSQGYYYGGVKTPVIATIGDSTFFHAGIPGLLNAVQYNVPMTLIVMDNGWTAMTGMQVNPGTKERFQQPASTRVDLAKVIPALGVEQFFMMDPFNLAESTATIQAALALPGVKVILARQECAIQAQRQRLSAGTVQVVDENCNLCKLCISVTGCSAISIGKGTIIIDPVLCYGCGLCAEVCNRNAILASRNVEVAA